MNAPDEQPSESRFFHVFERGSLTVVGFEARHLVNCNTRAECRAELLNLVESTPCQVLVVDLTDIDIVASWILGVLASVQTHGVEVHLYHPSSEVRGVLQVTHLDELLNIRNGLERAAVACD